MISFARLLFQRLMFAFLLGAAISQAQVGPRVTAAASSTDLVLDDGTPVRLGVTRDVSSANAKPGDRVDLEVLDEIKVGNVVVIKKGSRARGMVTAAQSARRMGRGGKLTVEIDAVTLADGETATLRRFKETAGDEHVGTLVAGAVIGSVIASPIAAPLVLFQQGEDICLERDTVITAYVSGAMRLDAAKFRPISVPVPPTSAHLRITSHPIGAEILVDGNFVGSTPSEIDLSQGEHTIRISKAGCRTWERTLSLSPGKSAMTATLYPVAIKLR